MTTTVRNLTSADHDAWHRLWDGYCEFYETDMPAEVTTSTWNRLIDSSDSTFFGLVAERDGDVIGIANCVLHGHTWSVSPRCYLNDLYVDPRVRGAGAGKAMIDAIRHMAAERGWDKVYWLTAGSNETARRLYDRYAPASGFIQYSVPPKEHE